MNYEKAYKEALERAKRLHKDAITLQLEQDIKDYETIFPELKESEDEKIRKELIQLIQCMHDADPRKVRWIAWLEKQSKKKSVWSEEDESILQEDPVSADLEQEIERYIGFPQEIDEDVSTTMIRKAARHFADWGRMQYQKEKVSEDLQEELQNFINDYGPMATLERCAVHFANWQKQQMIDKACKWLQLWTGLDDNKVQQFRESMEK